MLVYGDHREYADPAERLAALSEQLVTIAAMLPGIDRHAKLVGALIDAGQALQGAADAGCPSDELDRLVHSLSTAVVRSCDSGFAQIGELPTVPRLDLPRRVELKLPEGFAFYAVYPEAYIEAARRLRLLGPPRVIGIRSIGTTLGAVVAATLNAPPAISVRPFGDPFARRVELPPETVRAGAHYVIVDEGPGLSGSSFGSVADELERRGVPVERIAFLPSHAGDLGPKAGDAHRERWRKAQRVAALFDPAFLTDIFGPIEEFSTGQPLERRKYLTHQNGRRVLLKFAGLGLIGERKLEMARSVHAAGFTPEPIGLVHGFIVEHWCGDGRPLAADERPVEAIGGYIGARARLFPAGDEEGASIDELLMMCRRNISLALGEDAAGSLDRPSTPTRSKRIRTDNKLDRQEWLRTAAGKLLKTDALDHHQAHDMIGCQPVEWDIAGAIAEFDLSDTEAARLIAATRCDVDTELLDFLRVAYAAFRLGHASMAAELVGTGPVSERSGRDVDRYARQLQVLLHERACVGESAQMPV